MEQGLRTGWLQPALFLRVLIFALACVTSTASAANRGGPKPEPSTTVTWNGSGATYNGISWEPRRSLCYGDMPYLEFLLSGTKSTEAAITIPGGVTDETMTIVGSSQKTNTFKYLWQPESIAIDLGALVDNVTASYNVAGTPKFTLGTACLGRKGLILTKSIVGGDPYSNVGDVISYEFEVKNTGDTSLVGPVVINDDLTEDEACPDLGGVGNNDANLDPGEIITCTASYTVDSGDIAAGTVINIATASADGTASNEGVATATYEAIPVTQVSAGNGFTCALLGDSTVKCWGGNMQGQLGNGSFSYNSFAPTAVSALTGVTQLFSGDSHTCALLSDSTVKCWGLNGDGQLGDGTITNRNMPVAVPGLTGVTEVAIGDGHTCALLIDSTVKCWGYNGDGTLGNGSNSDSLTPVVVSNLTDAIQIAAGSVHTCALLIDSTVKCWGYNGDGSLGDGTNTDSNIAVAVSNLTGVTKIFVGTAHSCALLSDSTVKCWGYNGEFGLLGDGTTINRNTPVAVLGLTGVIELSLGDYHTCALLSDFTVKCWGYNRQGQLGDGTTINRNTPVAVLELSGATQIGAGFFHVCALLSDSTVQCWGDNYYGQLGDGTTDNRLTPVPVQGLYP